MRKKSKLTILSIILLLCSLTLMFFMCSKDKDDGPEITGCNSFKYKGKTYNNVGCTQGIRSFNISYNNGPVFHVECSGGCISSVTLAEGGLGKTVVGPGE